MIVSVSYDGLLQRILVKATKTIKYTHAHIRYYYCIDFLYHVIVLFLIANIAQSWLVEM